MRVAADRSPDMVRRVHVRIVLALRPAPFVSHCGCPDFRRYLHGRWVEHGVILKEGGCRRMVTLKEGESSALTRRDGFLYIRVLVREKRK